MKFLIITICFIVLHIQGNTQGCVAIRSNGGSCSLLASNSEHATTHKWMLGINNRYFKSYKHFVGNEEQKERVERGTEVINKHSQLSLPLQTKSIAGGLFLHLFL